MTKLFSFFNKKKLTLEKKLNLIKNGKIKFKLKDSLQEWAYGYVKLAEKKGILDEADILYFKLNESATRHEVAKYLVRAIGYENEAQKHMDQDLDYKDASFIPQGSVGYIYIANQEEIITGYPDETFRPFDKVTRAQMAVMVARLEGKVDDEDFDIYEGEVTEIDDGSDIDWIEIDNDERFDITNDTEVVFEDDEEGEIEDIEKGYDVEVKVNEDDKVIYIKVEEELYNEYKGEVTEIDDGSDIDWIEIDNDERFDITNDTEVVFEDDEEGEIEDIKIADDVKLKVNEDDEVIEITIDRDLDFDLIYGILDNIYEDEEQILVYFNSKYNTYQLDEDVEIILNFDDVDFNELKRDDNVRLELNKDDEVVKIKAYRY